MCNRGESLFTYLLKMMKDYFITLNTYTNLKDIYVVYDGPGFLSDALKDDLMILRLSTFQCLIQILPVQKNIWLFNFTANTIKPEQHLIPQLDEQIQVSFPNYNCTINKNIYILYLRTKYGY